MRPPLDGANTPRREFVQSVIAATALLPQITRAEEDGLVSRERIADLLHVVPTFTIVDPRGVPYMVVGEDAKVTGYFFTEYAEAQRILTVARSSADRAIARSKKDQPSEDLSNPWKQARVSTVPLDVAVSVVLRSSRSGYFFVEPSEVAVTDALGVTGQQDLAEGKVPLFYYEDFGTEENPLYFRKAELEDAYRKVNPKKGLPQLKVTELFAVLSAMALPGNGSSNDAELQRLVLVPPKESTQKAKDCSKNKGAAFIFGERNLVL